MLNDCERDNSYRIEIVRLMLNYFFFLNNRIPNREKRIENRIRIRSKTRLIKKAEKA